MSPLLLAALIIAIVALFVYVLTSPLYGIVLGIVALGFLIGALVTNWRY